MALPNYLSASDDVAKALFYGIAAFAIYKAYTGWQSVGKGIGETLGGWYADLTVPEVVDGQIKLKSAYFLPDGNLTPQAFEVITAGYPNLYRVAFLGRKIKPEYSHLVDSGRALTDNMFKGQ